MKTFRNAPFAILAWLCMAGGVQAQTTELEARILGRVVDVETKRPVVGALVAVTGVSTQAATDERGSFVLDHVPPGARNMTIEMLGYTTRTESIAVRAGAVHEIEVLLSRQAIELDPVEVRVRSGFLEARGFYARERESNGTFFTREDVEQRNAIQLTDLLRAVPGARVHLLDAGRRHVRFNRANTDVLAFSGDQEGMLPGCEPDIYVDGVQFRDRIPSNPRELKLDGFDVVTAAEIEGVEVYTGPTAPLQYQSSQCGVILVWTRRGNAIAPPPAASAATPTVTLPELPMGTLLRITPRFGGDAVRGIVQSIDGDRITLDGHAQPFTVNDIRKIEQSTGQAQFMERTWRGARWGLIAGLVGVAIAAAAEEFGELDEGGKSGDITSTSARSPAFGAKVVGATTLTGALLGGAFWRYTKWIEVRVR